LRLGKGLSETLLLPETWYEGGEGSRENDRIVKGRIKDTDRE
jgi:hypothetical protein